MISTDNPHNNPEQKIKADKEEPKPDVNPIEDAFSKQENLISGKKEDVQPVSNPTEDKITNKEERLYERERSELKLKINELELEIKESHEKIENLHIEKEQLYVEAIRLRWYEINWEQSTIETRISFTVGIVATLLVSIAGFDYRTLTDWRWFAFWLGWAIIIAALLLFIFRHRANKKEPPKVT